MSVLQTLTSLGPEGANRVKKRTYNLLYLLKGESDIIEMVLKVMELADQHANLQIRLHLVLYSLTWLSLVEPGLLNSALVEAWSCLAETDIWAANLMSP